MVESKKVRIRASMLDSWADCELRTAVNQWPELFEQRGFKLNPKTTGLGAGVGTGTHAGAAHLLKVKFETGSTPKSDDAQEVGILAMRKNLAEFDPALIVPSKVTPTVDAAEKQVKQLVHVYAAFRAPIEEPKMIEADEMVESEMNNVVQNRTISQTMTASLSSLKLENFEVSGHLDLLNKEDALSDLKSGSTKPSAHPAQIGLYVAILRTKKRIVVKSASSVFLKVVAVGKPAEKPQVIPYPVKEAEDLMISRVIRIGSTYEQFVISGRPEVFQQNAYSILCGPKYCRAFGTNACSAWMFKQVAGAADE